MKIKSGVFENMASENFLKIKEIELPRDKSYFLKRGIAEVAEKSKPYFEEKKSIIEKYKSTKNGDMFILPENIPHYLEELNIIQGQEVEVDFDKMELKVSDLPEKISAIEIDFLEIFFKIKE